MTADNRRLTGGTLLNSAIEYADLADVYAADRKPVDQNPLMASFLLARALELGLKAILRKDGWTEKQLRRVGHDVEVLYAEVLKVHAPKRLALSEARRSTLRLLRQNYTSKRFEYTVVGAYEVPRPYVLRGMVREVIRFAIDHVHGPGTLQRFSGSSKAYARGVEISPRAHYGNASRRRALRRQREALESFLDAVDDPAS